MGKQRKGSSEEPVKKAVKTKKQSAPYCVCGEVMTRVSTGELLRSYTCSACGRYKVVARTDI
jgi:hypothetical protein